MLYQPSEDDLIERKLSNSSQWPYPFDISSEDLKEITFLVEMSKSTIPTSTFELSFTGPISGKPHGYRGVDNIEALLNLIPTLFVPRLKYSTAKKPVLALCKAASLILKRNIDSDDLSIIERCVKQWFDLKDEINNRNILPGVMRPNLHLLYHVPYIIMPMGVLRSYSARSMERAIQMYKQRIKTRNSVDENIGNVLLKMNFQGYIKSLSWNIDEELNLLAPRTYSNNTFMQHKEDLDLQLWSPIKEECSLCNLPLGVDSNSFLDALQKYCLCEPYFSTAKLPDVKKLINKESIGTINVSRRVYIIRNYINQ